MYVAHTCVPNISEAPIWGASDNMGCIAASSTAIACRYGRHLPFSYNLGVPYLHIELPISLCALRAVDWQPLQ